MSTHPRAGQPYLAALVAAVTLSLSPLLLQMVAKQVQDEGSAHRIEDLAWITGHWVRTSGRARTEELWTAVAGGTTFGLSRTVAGEKTVEFEYLRIETRPDGIYYVAHPNARPGTDFKLVRLEGGEAVFENLAHDFPQRIIYRKNSDGSLFVRIEGDQNGKTVGRDFHFQPMRNK